MDTLESPPHAFPRHRWLTPIRQINVLPLLITLTVFLSGCAVSPYTKNTRPTTLDAGPALEQGTLKYSLRYADTTYDEYRAMLLADFEHRRNLNTGLVGIAAAILGLAAFDAHTDAIIGAALVGGTAYTLGTWNTSNDRLGIYLEGMKAMACAKAAIAPLRISKEKLESDEQGIRGRSVALKKALDETAKATGQVTAAIAQVTVFESKGQSHLLDTAHTELAEVDDVFQKATDLLSRGASLEYKVEHAGVLLESKVDRIRGLIDEAINGTLASLSTLPDMISSISNYANLFAPGLELGSTLQNVVQGIGVKDATKGLAPTAQSVGVSTKEGERPPKVNSLAQAQYELASALGGLRASRQSLRASMAILQGVVEPISLDAVKTSLAGCGVDTSKLTSGIRLGRTQVMLKPGVAQTSLVTITGGTRPYSAGLLDTPAPGINVSLPPGSNVLVVTATDKTQAGSSYQVRVGDAAEHYAKVSINVAGKEEPGNSNGPVSGQGQEEPNLALEGWEKTLSKEEVCLFQRMFGAAMADGTYDGNFGPQTFEAMKTNWGRVFPGQGFRGDVSDETRRGVKKLAGLAVDADDAAIKTAGWHCDGNMTFEKLQSGSGTASHDNKCQIEGLPYQDHFECTGITAADLLHARAVMKKQHNDEIDATKPMYDGTFKNALAQFQNAYNKTLSQSETRINDDGRLTRETWEALLIKHPK